ncbi:Na(+)/H(+) antiporter subunit D, partial [Kangiella sp. HD9-110m-PIT-SAG07]
MWMPELPAFVPFFIGALIALVTTGKVRQAVLLITPVLSGLHLLTVPVGTIVSFNFLNFQMEVFEVDKLSLLFGYIFHLAAFICMLFALHVKDTLQQVSGLLYAGSAI